MCIFDKKDPRFFGDLFIDKEFFALFFSPSRFTGRGWGMGTYLKYAKL